jgi:hypothetical protein
MPVLTTIVHMLNKLVTMLRGVYSRLFTKQPLYNFYKDFTVFKGVDADDSKMKPESATVEEQTGETGNASKVMETPAEAEVLSFYSILFVRTILGTLTRPRFKKLDTIIFFLWGGGLFHFKIAFQHYYHNHHHYYYP